MPRHWGAIPALASALYLAWTAPVVAQNAAACNDNEAVASCFLRLRRAGLGTPASGTAAVGDQDAALQKKAVGPNVAENLAQSAIRDFLPRFAGTLVSDDPTNDVRALDLRFNAPMRRASAPGFTFQGGITLHKAELFAPLVDSIPESIRDASGKRLSDELEDGDDATAFASLNVETRGLGRDFANQRDLVDAFSAAIAGGVNAQLEREQQDAAIAFTRFSAKLNTAAVIEPGRRNDPLCVGSSGNPLAFSLLPVSCLEPGVRAELEQVLVPFARTDARKQRNMAELLASTGFVRLADLVNNQPQLNFSLEYRNRVNVVGPNEWAGRVRYETGFANMNGLRRSCADAHRLLAVSTTPSATAVAQDSLRACLRRYTEAPRVTRSLDRSDRLWFEGELRYRPTYHVVLDDDSLDFRLGSGAGFAISGGYGRYLGSADAKKDDRDRIDLHVSYDHFDGADLRQSRFLAGAFYTLRVSGNVQGVVGLAWANKPEFLDGADRRLTANLGLSYKFNRSKDAN